MGVTTSQLGGREKIPHLITNIFSEVEDRLVREKEGHSGGLNKNGKFLEEINRRVRKR